MTDLNPCPFCGKPPYMILDYSYGSCSIGCHCIEGAGLSDFDIGGALIEWPRVVDTWNRRAPDPERAALVRALAESDDSCRSLQQRLQRVIDGRAALVAAGDALASENPCSCGSETECQVRAWERIAHPPEPAP